MTTDIITHKTPLDDAHECPVCQGKGYLRTVTEHLPKSKVSIDKLIREQHGTPNNE